MLDFDLAVWVQNRSGAIARYKNSHASAYNTLSKNGGLLQYDHEISYNVTHSVQFKFLCWFTFFEKLTLDTESIGIDGLRVWSSIR